MFNFLRGHFENCATGGRTECQGEFSEKETREVFSFLAKSERTVCASDDVFWTVDLIQETTQRSCAEHILEPDLQGTANSPLSIEFIFCCRSGTPRKKPRQQKEIIWKPRFRVAHIKWCNHYTTQELLLLSIRLQNCSFYNHLLFHLLFDRNDLRSNWLATEVILNLYSLYFANRGVMYNSGTKW